MLKSRCHPVIKHGQCEEFVSCWDTSCATQCDKQRDLMETGSCASLNSFIDIIQWYYFKDHFSFRELKCSFRKFPVGFLIRAKLMCQRDDLWFSAVTIQCWSEIFFFRVGTPHIRCVFRNGIGWCWSFIDDFFSGSLIILNVPKIKQENLHEKKRTTNVHLNHVKWWNHFFLFDFPRCQHVLLNPYLDRQKASDGLPQRTRGFPRQLLV